MSARLMAGVLQRGDDQRAQQITGVIADPALAEIDDQDSSVFHHRSQIDRGRGLAHFSAASFQSWNDVGRKMCLTPCSVRSAINRTTTTLSRRGLQLSEFGSMDSASPRKRRILEEGTALKLLGASSEVFFTSASCARELSSAVDASSAT